MSRWLLFFLFLVFTPSFLPHGLTTLRPPRVRPPCGWSTGFMTSPRAFGRFPIHPVLPALPPAPRLRALPHPLRLPGLPPRLELVLRVPHLADRGEAALVHQANLGARHA